MGKFSSEAYGESFTNETRDVFAALFSEILERFIKASAEWVRDAARIQSVVKMLWLL